MTDTFFFVALFDSVTQVMKAEKILKLESLPHKIIPVPRNISTDCGVCIRCDSTFVEKLKSALDGKVDIRELRPISSL